jgi:hypothetical protein
METLNDLKEGRHIQMMTAAQNITLSDYVEIYGNMSQPLQQIMTLEGPCYACHIIYGRANRFGLTDPFAYSIGNKTLIIDNITQNIEMFDSRYGHIIDWPEDINTSTYLNTNNNASISAELEVLSVSPTNFTVDSTIKVILANYSGQQIGNASCDCSYLLAEGETIVINISNMTEDYFKIIVILDGAWNNSLLNLRVNGTDKGSESFFIIANTHPFVYELPFNDSGSYYFKTNGSYKAVRLDNILDEWINYAMNNITTSDIIQTNSEHGLINASTCSAPNGMCHIYQKATYLGLSDGLNPQKSLYSHDMNYATSKQCKSCHLNSNRIR